MTLITTGTGGNSGTAGNIYDIAYSFVEGVQDSYDNQVVKKYVNFFNDTRLPSHIQESYPQFTEFIRVFYEWLASEQEVGLQELITDVDETSDTVLKLMKEI